MEIFMPINKATSMKDTYSLKYTKYPSKIKKLITWATFYLWNKFLPTKKISDSNSFTGIFWGGDLSPCFIYFVDSHNTGSYPLSLHMWLAMSFLPPVSFSSTSVFSSTYVPLPSDSKPLEGRTEVPLRARNQTRGRRFTSIEREGKWAWVSVTPIGWG